MPRTLLAALFLLLLLSLLLAPGCRTRPPGDPGAARDAAAGETGGEGSQTAADLISGVGTIRYVDLEGGFFGLVADDSTRLDPLNLSEDFKRDGLRVRFQARPRDDVMSIHMWGRIVELVEITAG